MTNSTPGADSNYTGEQFSSAFESMWSGTKSFASGAFKLTATSISYLGHKVQECANPTAQWINANAPGYINQTGGYLANTNDARVTSLINATTAFGIMYVGLKWTKEGMQKSIGWEDVKKKCDCVDGETELKTVKFIPAKAPSLAAGPVVPQAVKQALLPVPVLSPDEIDKTKVGFKLVPIPAANAGAAQILPAGANAQPGTMPPAPAGQIYVPMSQRQWKKKKKEIKHDFELRKIAVLNQNAQINLYNATIDAASAAALEKKAKDDIQQKPGVSYEIEQKKKKKEDDFWRVLHIPFSNKDIVVYKKIPSNVKNIVAGAGMMGIGSTQLAFGAGIPLYDQYYGSESSGNFAYNTLYNLSHIPSALITKGIGGLMEKVNGHVLNLGIAGGLLLTSTYTISNIRLNEWLDLNKSGFAIFQKKRIGKDLGWLSLTIASGALATYQIMDTVSKLNETPQN